MNATYLIAAAAMALFAVATPASAQIAQTAPAATSADAAMNLHLGRDYKHLRASGWVNIIMPSATCQASTTQGSADEHLQRLVAGYNRQVLDRGGWYNSWVAGGHYAAGEPLLAVAVGSGVTSGAVATSEMPHGVAAH